MTEERSRIRIRTALAWLATFAIIAYALSQEYQPEQASLLGEDAELELDDDKLRIVSTKPVVLAPGAALIVRVANAEPDPNVPMTAEVAKEPVEILGRSGDQLVLRVPHDAELGQAKVRVFQGERRSKPWVVTIRALPRADMLRNIVGGLALFVLGLRTMGRALRAYAGQRVRGALALLTRGFVRPWAVGALVGFLMQSTTSAAGLIAGLYAARMLKLPAAVLLLLGAQLGASIAAVLLPLIAMREALWVLCIGVLWLALADNRLTRALAMVVVGAGLIFHGLAVLQAGYAPLLSDPQLLPHLAYIHARDPAGLATSALLGAGLTALLQGPSPVFALVVSLAQSSALLTVGDGLAVLAGVSFGAVLGTAVAAWPFGRDARRLASAHLLASCAMTLVSVLGVPLFASLADGLVAGDAMRTDYTGEVLLPGMALHLGCGFLLSMAAANAAALVFVPWISRTVLGRRSRAAPDSDQAQAGAGGRAIAQALAGCRDALLALREVVTSSDRSATRDAEHALGQARQALLGVLEHDGRASTQERSPWAAAAASLHLCTAIDHALRRAEQAPEQGFAPSGATAPSLERIHQLVSRALETVASHAAEGSSPSLIDAQAREIELNAIEADVRRKLFERSKLTAEDLPAQLWASELCAAYEAIGNHLYRVTSALGASSELDDA